MPRTGRPKGSTGRAAVLTAAQIRHVFRVAKSRPRLGDRAEAIFALSLGLGLRVKELAALRCGDVYDEEGRVRPVLHLKAAYTKAGRTRDVFVSSPQVRQVLSTYGERCLPWRTAAPDRPLFMSQQRGHLTSSSMARFLKALYREAGIPQASSHSGRRTLITRLAERGIDLKSIAELAGHASIRTTAMYVEANPTRLARILQEVRW
jgi:integrase/recombinase XerD